MSDTKSPADAIAPALRDGAELRELARLFSKWARQDPSRLVSVLETKAAEAHEAPLP